MLRKNERNPQSRHNNNNKMWSKTQIESISNIERKFPNFCGNPIEIQKYHIVNDNLI